MDLKRPFDYKEQIEQLKRHNLQVDNESDIERFLHLNSYYRFSGYLLQYRKSENDSDLIAGSSFEHTRMIYSFDADMRTFLRKYIEIAEVYYRNQICHGFVMRKCTKPPYDQHYDESNYYRKDVFNNILNNLSHQENYYRDTAIVKHHHNKYNDKYPLWVMVEMMSMSDLSRLYSAMYYSEQDAIANAVGTKSSILENNLHCLALLRNKCAHCGRLYGVSLNPPARLPVPFLRHNPNVAITSLFAYIYVLMGRLPEEFRQSFLKDLFSTIFPYQKLIDYTQIGFPENYLNILHRLIK